MRVGADGALLDATDTPIAGHHPAEIYPALASNGRGLLLLSSDRTSRIVLAQRAIGRIRIVVERRGQRRQLETMRVCGVGGVGHPGMLAHGAQARERTAPI
jgi:hypothetical protein